MIVNTKQNWVISLILFALMLSSSSYAQYSYNAGDIKGSGNSTGGITYTLGVSTGQLTPSTSYPFDTTKGVTSGSPSTISISVSSGSASGTVEFSKYKDLPTSDFTISMNGKLVPPPNGSGSQPTWSAQGNAKAPYFIKSDKSNDSRDIMVKSGDSFTYTAYEGGPKSSNWTVSVSGKTTATKNDSTSISMGSAWWDLFNWAYDFTPPDPGVYNIGAVATDKSGSDSGVATVVGVASISGPNNKSSSRKEAPSSIDDWTSTETIYASPCALVNLTANITPAVTLTDEIKSAIEWSSSGTGTVTQDSSDPLKAVFKDTLAGDNVITVKCGTSQRVILVRVVIPKIHAVTFTGNKTILKDDSSGSYSGPDWQDDDLDGTSDLTNANADSSKPYHPIAYRSTDTMEIIDATFKLDARNAKNELISGVSYDVTSTTTKLRFTPYTLLSSNDWAYSDFTLNGNSVAANNQFYYSYQVGYKSNLQLAWEVGFGESEDSLEWYRSYSENEFYLTKMAPTTSDTFETVFHISCTMATGETTNSGIVSDVWGHFSGRGVQRKDGNSLYYYKSYRNVNCDTASLLFNKDGQCGSWAMFLIACLGIQGIPTTDIKYVFARPSNANGFIVKNWTFADPGSSGDANFPYINAVSGNVCLDTSYSWGTPNEVNYTSGTAGQNNSKPASLFGNHQMIKYNGTYYDASYGLTHSDTVSIDNTLDGFFNVSSTSYIFMKNPTGVQITLTEYSL